MTDETSPTTYFGLAVATDARPAMGRGPGKAVQRGPTFSFPVPEEDQAPIPAHQPRGVKKPIARGPVMFIPRPLFAED